MSELLLQALVYLAAAVVAVPIASRLGLGSVLGYLIAGVVVGPWALDLVGDGTADVMHAAEFGVVMMLFLVGLELDPARLWSMRRQVFGLGGLQIVATAAVVAPLAMAVGLPWQQGVALGLILGMSSTAIALQTLAEKGLSKSEAGHASFAILLFQDIAVIPILALFPLLATLPVAHPDAGHSGSLVTGLPAWQHALFVLGAIGAVVVVGRMLVGPLLRVVARSGLREMFTASALLIVIGVALLMSAVGLSAALGTFVAGVVLANSEFRHELVSDVEPFKGLLLGLFFMAVGASIDFGILASQPLGIAGVVVAAILVKIAVLLAVARVGRLSLEQGTVLALVLAQVGEFAFVLFSFASQNGILPVSVTAPMMAVTAFSMAATPFLLAFQERVIAPRLRSGGADEHRESDVVDEHHPVIVAGYGRFGQIVGRLLRQHGFGVTVLDVDSEQVEVQARFGQKVFYGDGSRLDLLHAAGAATAKILVIAMDDPAKVEEIVHTARRHFPHLALLARARGRTEAYDLVGMGVEGVYRETFDTALRVGVDALRRLGVPAYAATRSARNFRTHDERALWELASHRGGGGEAWISKVRERMRDVEEVLRQDREGAMTVDDHGWDSEPLRQAMQTDPDPPDASPHVGINS